MPAYGNPVPGFIHPVGWKPPAGNLDMYVIRDCAGHQATNQGCALDINNGRCDGKVLAAAAGRVQHRDDVQGIIRIDHADGSRTGYAHMKPILVSLGQQVAQGQQIGEIGDAHDPAILNFSGCHLHFAIQLSIGGPEVDPWPYMNAGGGDMLKGTPILQTVNQKATVLGDNTRFRPSPGTAEPELVMLPAGEECYVAWLVDGGLALGSTRWYGFWKQTAKGIEFGYVSEKLLSALNPIEQSGHTDAELMEAARKAGHNAAVDVQAVGVTALNTVAAKYP